ncbi:MAG: hypothetical protein ACE5Z5_03360 [Candidatus Bathyarchaeia archaeon]
MIEISEPLPESKQGYNTVHDILLEGERIGSVSVGYLRKDEIKAFRRTKRRLRVGQPFGVQVFIDTSGGKKAESSDRRVLREIVNALMTKFKGLEERDIYLLEVSETGKKVIGRATSL